MLRYLGYTKHYQLIKEEVVTKVVKNNLDIKAGTVLAIPLGNGQWALGQVIQSGVNFYLGVATKIFDEPLSADLIQGQKLEIFSWTNDAEVYRGNWRNLGKYELQSHPPLPEYKVTISGKTCVESFTGESIRDFDPAFDSALQFRKIRSPLLVQDAVQAACGFGEWKPLYSQMKDKNAVLQRLG